MTRAARVVALVFVASLVARCTDQPTAPRRLARPALGLSTAPTGGGSRIAFESNRDGNFEIYVMDADGSSQARLTNSPGDDEVPRWSPDGRRIAFQSTRDGNLEIYVMNADGSEQTRLTNDPAVDASPTWSPDGQRIAFHSTRDGNTEIYIMNADGSGQTRLTNSPLIEADPSWSPSGTPIAFRSTQGALGWSEISVMDPHGTSWAAITSGPTGYGKPAWSPDGQRIAYVNGSGEIFVMGANGSGQTQLTSNPLPDDGPRWSPDGKQIVFTSFRFSPGGYDVFVMNADGSSVTRLTSDPASDGDPDWQPAPPPLPPTGERIAFMSERDGNREIYLMNPDGSAQTRLTTDPSFDDDPSWSPDGRRIAFSSFRAGNAEIYVMNADGSAQTRLTTDLSGNVNPSWSPDGHLIAFASRRNGSEDIYVMNADGSDQTRLTTNPSLDIDPAWSPDGQRIAFTSYRDGDAEIYVMNADGSAQTNLTNQPGGNDVDPSWSPDGRYIAFASNRGGNFEIYVMNSDGSAQAALTHPDLLDRDVNVQPSWSPNSQRIAFVSDFWGNFEIHVMNADGSAETRLTSTLATEAAPAWGPAPLPNEPPVANAGPDQTSFRATTAGAAVTLDGTGSSDPDDDPLDYQWRVGSTVLATGATPTVVLGLGVHSITLQVSDGSGASSTDEVAITVLNSAPTAEVGGPYAGDEGVAIPLALSGVDVDGAGLEFSWDLGDGTTGTGPTPPASHAYADGPSTLTITLTVHDADGGVDTKSTLVTVANVAPSGDLHFPVRVDEGSPFTLSLSNVRDVPADLAGLLSRFDCGLGFTAWGTVLSATCPTDDNGIRPVRAEVKDKDGGVSAYAGAVVVTNVAPVLGAVTVPLDPVLLGAVVRASASFTDPGTADIHVGFVSWDMGGPFGPATPGVDQTAHTLTATSALAAGVHTIALRVRDDDNGEDTRTASSYVVVYDPNAGFVTGSGWITGPPGAYVPNPALSGKASFAFVAKYQKGATLPSGSIQFSFPAASLTFQSTSYQWLVVAGVMAQFKGEGTINGGPTAYGFLLTAIDGQMNGGGGSDKVRLKIWDKSTGAVVYDNQGGARDDGGAAGVLGGGSIVIHAN